jgi:hypothetical protein
MKKLKCSTCKKEIEVNNDYQFKTCENCLVKKRAKDIELKEMRKLDKESQNQIKSLKLTKLPYVLRKYSIYAQNHKKLFHSVPSFDDYMQALRAEKLNQAHERAERIRRGENVRQKQMPDENLGKPVNVQFSNEGDILGDIRTNETAQYPKTERSLGANAFHDSVSEPNEPKPKSNQQRLKDIFGEQAE